MGQSQGEPLPLPHPCLQVTQTPKTSHKLAEITQKSEKLKKDVIFDPLAEKTEGHFDSFWDVVQGLYFMLGFWASCTAGCCWKFGELTMRSAGNGAALPPQSGRVRGTRGSGQDQ